MNKRKLEDNIKTDVKKMGGRVRNRLAQSTVRGLETACALGPVLVSQGHTLFVLTKGCSYPHKAVQPPTEDRGMYKYRLYVHIHTYITSWRI